MPRKKKTDKTIGCFDAERMRQAVDLVIKEKKSARKVAVELGLKFQTLYRYVKKYKENPDCRMSPNYSVNLVIPRELELELVEYLLQCSRMFYGLTLKDCSKLTYQLALKNGLKMPSAWEEFKMATDSWMRAFRKRHPQLALRTPEACSLSRATSFNPTNVNKYFDNLDEVYSRHENFANGTRVYNLDETATTTVQVSAKVIAEKGARQFSKATSAERGTLVTTCCFINATGTHLPPVMIFPRVNFKPFMLKGAPTGTLGLAAKSGWMTAELFVDVLKHFVKHICSSPANPSLLLMDNHESHLSIEALDYCKENGVTVLTFPPHCTHKLQPLDVGVMKPFKAYYNSCVDDWMRCNPGNTFSIYDVAGCVGIAYPKAMNPVTIINSFRKTGIMPFDRDIFTEYDFMGCAVTDRNDPSLGNNASTSQNERPSVENDVATPKNERPGPSTWVSPEDVLPFPKAGPRKNSGTQRNKGRTMIPTDTPEKMLLEEKKLKRKCRKQLFSKKKLKEDTSDESDEGAAESETSDEELSSEKESEDDEELVMQIPERDPDPDEYILVEFKTKAKPVYYVGRVIERAGSDYNVRFLRRATADKFHEPDVSEEAMVLKSDIKMILTPIVGKATKRQSSYVTFSINFSNINVR